MAFAPLSQRVAIDAYIGAKVAQEIALRVEGESFVSRDLANKAEDEVVKRIKRYSWIVAAFLALLGIYGFTSIRDAKQKIVDEARGRVEPIVSDVEKRAQDAQAKLKNVEANLPEITASLNETSAVADSQRKRIEGQGSEIANKLSAFQAATERADRISAGFDNKVTESQRKLGKLCTG